MVPCVVLNVWSTGLFGASSDRFQITPGVLLLNIFIYATFPPFLSPDIPEFQTGSLGGAPMGWRCLHFVSPPPPPPPPLSFSSLSSSSRLSERRKECVRPSDLSSPCLCEGCSPWESFHLFMDGRIFIFPKLRWSTHKKGVWFLFLQKWEARRAQYVVSVQTRPFRKSTIEHLGVTKTFSRFAGWVWLS